MKLSALDPADLAMVEQDLGDAIIDAIYEARGALRGSDDARAERMRSHAQELWPGLEAELVEVVERAARLGNFAVVVDAELRLDLRDWFVDQLEDASPRHWENE